MSSGYRAGMARQLTVPALFPTADLSAVWDVVRASPLAAGPHTSTLLGVACLGYTGQLVEITAVATAG